LLTHGQFNIIERRFRGELTEYLVRVDGEERTAWVSELRVPPAYIRQFEEDLQRRPPPAPAYMARPSGPRM
jgi:hypothetical protein